jgi:hypothetical protein
MIVAAGGLLVLFGIIMLVGGVIRTATTKPEAMTL